MNIRGEVGEKVGHATVIVSKKAVVKLPKSAPVPAGDLITIGLPWPPSTNTYWRHVGHKVLLSAKGRSYRKDVTEAVGPIWTRTGRVAVQIVAFPPDRRKRDLDNLLKATFDSMTHAGVWEDDSQIDRITIHRGDVTPGGWLSVTVEEIAA